MGGDHVDSHGEKVDAQFYITVSVLLVLEIGAELGCLFVNP